ncbi:hypothetical protein MesoLjLc_19280 [Mesorhizobium sp. L-8-10]|nr:hypothetical protein MesoLjLc_19280 [Mesorhizobium sp. L-8-10]
MVRAGPARPVSFCARHGARSRSTDMPGWYPADDDRSEPVSRFKSIMLFKKRGEIRQCAGLAMTLLHKRNNSHI